MSKQQAKMTASDFNLKTLSTSELSKHIACTIQIEGNIAIFGRRGTGKTMIAKTEIAKAGLREVYINLSVLERVDMGGYPNVLAASQEKKFVDFILPLFYEPMMNDKRGVVVLLDEVDKADPSLWAPLLEFVQFRTINGQALPYLKSIIMTGNLISEGGSRPALPLLDRTEKFLVEADSKSWLDWAGRSGKIHPSITAYIHHNPAELFGAPDPDDRYADPSPRGWERASQIISKGEKKGWDSLVLNQKVCGCVGKDSGLKYSHYYDHYIDLLPMIDALYEGEDIRHKYESLDTSKQLVCCMISCAHLSNLLDELQMPILELPPAVKYMGQFLNYVSHENVLTAVRSQIVADRLIKYGLDDLPVWKEVLRRVTKEIEQ